MHADSQVKFELEPQPTDTSCGPTCLQAVYNFYEDLVSVTDLIDEIPELETGGTLAVQLGVHALRRGYEAEMFTYNLRVFDPTWFEMGTDEMADRLRRRMERCQSGKRRLAMKSYLEFLRLGGAVRLEVLNEELIRSLLESDVPILTGLSSTFLYSSPREIPTNDKEDDIRGEPVGHFVVLCGYNGETGTVSVADPDRENPMSSRRIYPVPMDRLINAILLGVFTYDGNLLVLRPR
jgi:hypothetical protein